MSYSDNFSDGQNHNSYAYPTTVTNAAGQSQYSQYDYSSGLPVAVSSLNGAYTLLDYSDPLNRLTRVARPDGGTSNIYYENPTWTVYCQDKNSANDCGYTSQSFSDGLGRAIEQRTFEDGSNYISTHTTYDALGRVQTQTNPSRVTNGNPDGLGFQTTYTYDAAGRTTQVQTVDGSSTNTSYNGAIVTVADQANHQKAYGFDGIGRLAWVQEDPGGLSYMTNYIRDALDNVTNVNQCDSGGCQGRSFEFDSFSRLTQATNPESGVTHYEYDLAGNVTKKTDARGVVTSPTYDALNRLIGKSYSDGTPSVVYTYDGGGISNSIGQLTHVASAYGITNYTGFDSVGRVLGSNQLIGPSTFSFNYTYDLAGDLLSETYPTGRIISNRYDGAGRVANVTGSLNGQGTTYANVYSFWPHGAPYYFGYGNNVVPVYVYNNRLQLYGAWASINNDPNQFLETLALNWGGNTNNGNLLATGEYYGDAVPQGQMSSFSQNYGYDNVNRLTSASENGRWSRSYAYDKTGNGWVTANNGVPLMGNTPTSNVYDNGSHLAGQSYDLAGNQTSANGDSLSYDAENRLTAATEPVYLGGGTESFVYDGLGQRTEKSSPSETFVYAYDAFGALAVKYAPWNTVLQEYVRMGGQLIATENSGTSPCQTCYFVWDHLGSTRLVTDQNANVVARHDYLPFGEEIPGGWAGRSSEWGATNDTNEKFTGQQRDLETGLDYFHARYLSSSLGRFTSADPANAGANPYDPQSWNGYSYARNNPLALVDPSGMFYGSGSGDDGGCDDDPFCGGDYPPPPPSDPTPPPVTTTQEEPVPRGSFPGGETLGLPPGFKIPGPFSAQVLLGLWDWDCESGVCVPGFGSESYATSPNSGFCSEAGGAPDPSVYAALGKASADELLSGDGEYTGGLLINHYAKLFAFRRGGSLDAQPLGASRAYGNYVYGAYLYSAGFSLPGALYGANAYAAVSKAQYPNQRMDSKYSFIPADNVANITRGFYAARNGVLCHK